MSLIEKRRNFYQRFNFDDSTDHKEELNGFKVRLKAVFDLHRNSFEYNKALVSEIAFDLGKEVSPLEYGNYCTVTL